MGLPSRLVARPGHRSVGSWLSALSPTRLPLRVRAGVQVALELCFSSPAWAGRGGAGKKEEPGVPLAEGEEEEEQEGVKTELAPAVGVSVFFSKNLLYLWLHSNFPSIFKVCQRQDI